MKFQLTIEAEKLKRSNPLRNLCPYALVSVSGGSREGDVLGQTEVVENSLDPRWGAVVYVDTDASVYLPITVEIFDSNDGRDDKKIAEASFEVTAIYESQAHTQFESKGGTIIRVTVVQSIQGNLSGTAALQFRLLDVKNIESGVLGLGRTDPFLEIEKKNSDADAGVTNWIVTHRTEQVIDNLNPVFKEFQIPIEDLCYCDGDWPLRIVVRDWQRNGKHRTLGLHETTFNGLKESVAQGGNADRTSALDIHKEGKTTTEGLLVVLKAEL